MKLVIWFFLTSVVLAAHFPEAAARTRESCREQWFDGEERSEPTTTTPCKTRKMDARGPYFAVIGGKPYFHVTVSMSFASSSLFGRFGTTNVREERNFWALPGAVQLNQLRTWSRAGRIAPRYASDGARIFYQSRAIDGVDLASFEVLNAALTADARDDDSAYEEMKWSRDRRQLFFKGQPVPHARPDDVRRMSKDLIASNGRIFQISFDGIKERTDIDPTLRRLNWAYSVDKKNVYFRGSLIEGADPRSFEVMKAECPLQGHPNLRCEPPGKFDDDRRKAGFTDFDSPQSGGAYLWWGKDKNYVYRNQDRIEFWDGVDKAVSAKGIRFFLLPSSGRFRIANDPVTGKQESYQESDVYLINSTHIVGSGWGRSSLRYVGALAGPFDDGDLQDDEGRFSAHFLKRN